VPEEYLKGCKDLNRRGCYSKLRKKIFFCPAVELQLMSSFSERNRNDKKVRKMNNKNQKAIGV
jgi:hypothetical protein